MPWIELKLDIPSELADTMEGLLTEAGAAAVTFEDNADQPLFEPPLDTNPLWETTCITGLFDATADMEDVIRFMKNGLKTDDVQTFPPYRIEILEDREWEREWLKNFKPMKFGRRLWVCPSHQQPPEPGAVNLLLDPGLAFGTGTHATTALCLEWLDGQSLQGNYLIDYGCGSGILTVAAARLGCAQVTGVDIDPQALQATRTNLDHNNIPRQITHVCFPDELSNQKADVLIANILAKPLLDLAQSFAAHTKTGARIALSGILVTQAPEIIQGYRRWFDLELVANREDWALVCGSRK